MKWALRLLSGSVALVGAILLAGSVPTPYGWVNWPTSFVAPGAGLLGIGLTTFVAQLGLETVLDKRLSAIEASTRQNRSSVYEEVLKHIIESFGGSQEASEHEVRARIATWASTDTLRALTDWLRYAEVHENVRAISAEDLAIRYELLFRVIKTMRNDLQLDMEPVDKAVILSCIFSDYDTGSLAHIPTSHIRVSSAGIILRGSD